MEARRKVGVEVISFLEGWTACGCITLLAPAAPGCGAREEEEVGGRQGSGQRRAFPGRALTHRGLCAKHGYLKAHSGAMPQRSCLPFSAGIREQSAREQPQRFGCCRFWCILSDKCRWERRGNQNQWLFGEMGSSASCQWLG